MSCHELTCVKFQVGFKCNMSCSFCIVQGKELEKTLSLETVKYALSDRELREQLKRVVVTGGEPTIPEYLPIALNIIKQATEIGAESTIYSNGKLLNKNVLEQLRQAGLTEIRLSMYEPIDWDKLNSTLDLMGEYGFGRFLKLTVTRKTYCNVENVLEKLPTLKPDRFQIKPFNQTGIYEVDVVEEMTPDQVLELAAMMLEYRKSVSFRIDLLPLSYEFLLDDVPIESICKCNCGKGNDGYLVIDPEGMVLPCGAYSKPIGRISYNGSPLLEMWEKSSLLADIRHMEYDPPAECKSCHALVKCLVNDCHSTTYNFYNNLSRGNPQCPILARERFSKGDWSNGAVK